MKEPIFKYSLYNFDALSSFVQTSELVLIAFEMLKLYAQIHFHFGFDLY